jgi:hypothetical protein
VGGKSFGKIWFDMDDPRNNFRLVATKEELEMLVDKLTWLIDKIDSYDIQ